MHLDGRKRQGMLDDDFDDQMNYINGKQQYDGHDPTSPSSTYVGTVTSPIQHTPGMSTKHFENDFGAPMEQPEPPKQERRICGLRRGPFWFLAVLTVALVVVAALVGGIVGGLRNRHHSSPPPPPPAPSSNAPTGPTFPAAS